MNGKKGVGHNRNWYNIELDILLRPRYPKQIHMMTRHGATTRT